MHNTTQPVKIWESTVGANAAGSTHDTPRLCGVSAGGAAVVWTAQRGHPGTVADDDRALLFVAHPFRAVGAQNDDADALPGVGTSAELWDVPRGGTYDFSRETVGSLLDCMEIAPAVDAWLADDFCGVSGVNPLLTWATGARRIYVGPAVFAGHDDGETVSLPSVAHIAALAHRWHESAQITLDAAKDVPGATRIVLPADGASLVNFDVAESRMASGDFAVRIDAATPCGPAAQLLEAMRKPAI